ncbi:MAG TPA: diacylglycerol kinase family protein [Candidatus Saccharimonadales bacterium]|nr:diacylglycerol kinase family protein [Candidatus Saccharimonadales bacterium]
MKKGEADLNRPDPGSLLVRFDRLVVIYNPVSTNSRRSRRRIAELKDLFPSKEVAVVETSPDGLEANKKLIAREAKKFNKRTLICIAAGDGTVSAVLDALLTDKSIPAAARKVPILPLWGGNANDLAYMANGFSNKNSLKHIFEKGEIVPVYPLSVRVSHKKKINKRVAACYVSFGASAYAAQQTELPKNKKKKIHVIPGTRVATEFWTVTKALIKAKTFTINVDGEEQSVYERIFVNGSRIAKIDRLPVKLNERAFYEATLDKKHPKALVSLLSALKILRNRTYGEISEKNYSFALNSEAWSQIDGEVVKLPAGTEIEISLSPVPFHIISTKLG